MIDETDDVQPLIVLTKQNNKYLTKASERVKHDLPKYWERDFINNKLASISNHEHKMLMTFLWMSGVRITEAINLKKSDIDFNTYFMTVKWLKSRKYNNRIVPIHPRLKELLQLYTATMKAEDNVFDISRQRAWQIVQQYFNGNPHMFRHSFAVNWIRCDGDITILHRILGHSKIQTTMEYLKIVPIDQGKELIKIQF